MKLFDVIKEKICGIATEEQGENETPKERVIIYGEEVKQHGL